MTSITYFHMLSIYEEKYRLAWVVNYESSFILVRHQFHKLFFVVFVKKFKFSLQTMQQSSVSNLHQLAKKKSFNFASYLFERPNHHTNSAVSSSCFCVFRNCNTNLYCFDDLERWNHMGETEVLSRQQEVLGPLVFWPRTRIILILQLH